jgi:hypothetical protein
MTRLRSYLTGLLNGILRVPLAPLRTALWAAEQEQAAAEREYYDPAPIQRALVELEQARREGRIDEKAYDRREEELRDHLDEIYAILANNARRRAL